MLELPLKDAVKSNILVAVLLGEAPISLVLEDLSDLRYVREIPKSCLKPSSHFNDAISSFAKKRPERVMQFVEYLPDAAAVFVYSSLPKRFLKRQPLEFVARIAAMNNGTPTKMIVEGLKRGLLSRNAAAASEAAPTELFEGDLKDLRVFKERMRSRFGIEEWMDEVAAGNCTLVYAIRHSEDVRKTLLKSVLEGSALDPSALAALVSTISPSALPSLYRAVGSDEALLEIFARRLPSSDCEALSDCLRRLGAKKSIRILLERGDLDDVFGELYVRSSPALQEELLKHLNFKRLRQIFRFLPKSKRLFLLSSLSRRWKRHPLP